MQGVISKYVLSLLCCAVFCYLQQAVWKCFAIGILRCVNILENAVQIENEDRYLRATKKTNDSQVIEKLPS